MNIGCISTYLGLYFLSTIIYSFKIHFALLLNLFLRFYSFWCYKWNCFPSFTNFSLPLHRNIIYFVYLSCLHSATLLNSFISSNHFLVDSYYFWVFSIPVCHLHIASFTSFFHIWIHFIYFSCLIALTRTSNTVLNRNNKSGYLILGEKHLIFHHYICY